jgi:hypothetical protein
VQPAHHVDRPLFGNQAFIGAPERHPERHHECNGARFGNAQRLEVLLDRLIDRHILVLFRVGRADGNQAEHFVDFSDRGAARAMRVRYQRAIGRSRPALYPLENSLGIAQMRDDLRMRKTRYLDDRQTQIRKQIDHPHLGVGIDPARKTL